MAQKNLCKHPEWVTYGTTRKGSRVTSKWKCTKCGKIETDTYIQKPPEPKKKPIRKKVVRTVWRHFCPDCGKEVIYHDYSGGMEGDQGFWECKYCGLRMNK